MKFLIAIEPDTVTTAYGVVVPDLPGCFSAGDTLEEAFEMAREAIEVHCELLAEDGGDMPQPAPMAQHMADPSFAGWTWGLVEVAVERYFGPAEKINITVPARVLARIDAYARRHGESRSGFLVRAAQGAMAEP
jgi:predicted RNase H-like HicB family nuclease